VPVTAVGSAGCFLQGAEVFLRGARLYKLICGSFFSGNPYGEVGDWT